MSKKTDQVQKLLKKIAPRHGLPRPVEGLSLLEHGILVVLVRHLPQERAEAALTALKKTYPDWNELRVAQAQEIAAELLPKAKRDNKDAIRAMVPAAREARDFVQEVFQKTHGLELEFLKEDPASAGKLVQQMPLLGISGGSYLLWLAGGRQLPIHGALVRVLDRLGLISRTASLKKARDVIDPLVPGGEALAFVTAFGEVADLWCDARKPICQECVLVEECVFGKKAYAEWKTQQVRLEAQRARDEARRIVTEKKDAARRAREESRAAKKAEIEARRRERERKRQEGSAAKARPSSGEPAKGSGTERASKGADRAVDPRAKAARPVPRPAAKPAPKKAAAPARRVSRVPAPPERKPAAGARRR